MERKYLVRRIIFGLAIGLPLALLWIKVYSLIVTFLLEIGLF